MQCPVLAAAMVATMATGAWAAAPVLGPQDEAALIKTVEAYSEKYDAAANDMAKGLVHRERARDLCAARGAIKSAGGKAEGWTGTVETLDAVGNGSGVLGIRIAPHVTLSTANNELSESVADYKTLIPVNSPVYKVAVGLQVGEKVTFSGQLFPSKDDCLVEQSLTMGGGMDDPDFLFRFTALAPAK